MRRRYARIGNGDIVERVDGALVKGRGGLGGGREGRSGAETKEEAGRSGAERGGG